MENFLSVKDIQARFWNKGSNSKELLFKDSDTIIEAQLSWNEKYIDYVDNITLYLENKNDGNQKFEIIKLIDCKHKIDGLRYILIHLYKNRNSGPVDSSKISFNEIPLMRMRKGESILFLFRIHPENKPPKEEDITCDLTEPQPKSKDGAIIVSI